ncbi:DUF4139 domain-containing protein [Sphingomonas pituitosa]|uniref:DUF4139 domain-containing protein n=1 Tax=Sphingomonas pituitosa TaxID=99597 RepID=UPI0008369A92|nr:hypothetical protein [Sphingomonas pituitosa]
MLGRIPFGVFALLIAAPAGAQALVLSEKPDAVAVTLYRDVHRQVEPGQGWPGGYALVTETRTIPLPAGPSVIRFVGVSEGMMPETAIVTGLPHGVGEKNRDARLLGPATLVDAYLKRSVIVRRTDRATGKVTESDAVIQAGPDGGVLLSTPQGVEALGCSGLPEAIRYPGVPEDLAAKPTLSVTSDSATAQRVTVQLSYLAQGFDWSASYVARLGEGDTLDLFGWMTVVNGGSQGFADARTSAVAGKVNKGRAAPLPRGAAPELRLQCWPLGNTSMAGPPPPRFVDSVVAEDIGALEIVVTGSRIRGRVQAAPAPPPPPPPMMMAQQEELGDLKLYRVPEPVTVAALSTKQVALLHRESVKIARIYRGAFPSLPYSVGEARPPSSPTAIVLRAENRTSEGLGLPLPAGKLALFAERDGAPVLLGESDLADRAVGEEVELLPGTSSDVRYTVIGQPAGRRREAFRIEVSNAHDAPVTFELPIPYPNVSADAPLVERKGVKTWRVIVPANGTAVLNATRSLAR